MPCHEYCGFGHHGMWAHVVVVPRDHFPKLGPDERMTCVPR
jgi:cytochrome c oxidase subunit II